MFIRFCLLCNNIDLFFTLWVSLYIHFLLFVENAFFVEIVYTVFFEENVFYMLFLINMFFACLLWITCSFSLFILFYYDVCIIIYTTNCKNCLSLIFVTSSFSDVICICIYCYKVFLYCRPVVLSIMHWYLHALI